MVAALALRERPNRAQVAGVVTGSVGLGWSPSVAAATPPALAVLLCLLVALSWAIGNGRPPPARRPRAGGGGSLSLTVWSSLIVPLPALALSALLDGPAAITVAIGQFGWRPDSLDPVHRGAVHPGRLREIFNRLLATNRSAAVVPWVLLAPVVAMISASVLLGQRPNVWETVGGLTLVLGVLFANLPVGRAERPRV